MSLANSGSRPVDRRRRMMALEPEQPVDDIESPEEPAILPFQGSDSAFEGLSRDRLMRRIITPRLWKLVLLGIVLSAGPLLLVAFSAVSSLQSVIDPWLRTSLPVALAGVELLIAAQLCWLIACVRSASTVDYRGGYRSWKRLSMFIGGVSLLVLSNSAGQGADQLASLLTRFTGPLNAARPALVIVPALACLVWILRTVIPDMGRCRPAQALLSLGTVIGIVYLVLSIRRNPDQPPLSAGLPLMAAGIVLTAMLLHTRFVIYINPNPPEKRRRKVQQTAAMKKREPTTSPMDVEAASASSEVAVAQPGPMVNKQESQSKTESGVATDAVRLATSVKEIAAKDVAVNERVPSSPEADVASGDSESAGSEPMENPEPAKKQSGSGKQKAKNRRKAG